MENARPNPETLLARIAIEEKKAKRGHLKLFFGMAAGVGKTYQMLRSAHELVHEGVDVWIGFIETHGRKDTAELVEGIPIIPRQKIEYKGTVQEEMDFDAILKKRPQLVLIDELAHTNVPGSRHEKRYQDVLEVLDAGIDVYSTMNVQHLESRADIVGLITAVQVRETVPDTVLDMVDQIELIDITPGGLIERLKEGKVYPGRKTEQALQYFFQEGNLSALREMVLRVTANKVERDMRGEDASKDYSKDADRQEKLLVAVSHSPFSERLIRTARRVVEELEIKWVAVHIDTGRILDQENQNQLIKNLDLARELGAETVSLHGTDIAETISDYVAKNNIVQMIVGRPSIRPKWWQRPPRIIEQLIKQNPNVDVTVLQQSVDLPQKKGVKIRIIPVVQWPGLFKALLLLAATFVINLFLSKYIGYRTVGLLFLLLTIMIGLLFPLTTILIAAASSCLLWDYFFIPPTGAFSINAPEDVMMFLVFFVVALTSGFLTSRIKQSQKILKNREAKTRALYEILRSMSLIHDIGSIIEFVLKKIEEMFDAKCSVFLSVNNSLSNEADYGKLALSDKEKAVAAWSYMNGRAAGWSTDTLPLSVVMCIPLRSADDKFGVLAFKPKMDKKFTPDETNLLFGMAGQIGVVLAKKKFEDNSRDTTLIQESEKLHKTILSCVSHELRTPLTAIMGAASVLKSQMKTEDADVKALYDEILQASEKLNQIFENLLDVTRLEGGTVKLKQEWFDISELINFAIDRRKKQLAEHKIKLNLSAGQLYLFGDFKLLEHALSNILLNAANYSPIKSEIVVSVRKLDNNVVIDIADEGPGIPDEFISSIFDKFYRVPGTKPGGLGLGLSITKNMLEIHGVKIKARNNAGGGATFSIVLPYLEPPKQITI